MRYKSRTRALASAALAASLGLAGLAFTASPVQASETTDVVRVAGTTRYGTAADAATSAYPAGSANVVLASGEKFPDALAGGGLAGSLDAPILLTLEDSLPADTIAALAELGAETVTILGGTAAVSAAVEAELVALGYATDRVAGADRFETAADIAAELGGTTAVLANGLRFPDALAISPGAHALELPVLLTLADSLHEDAAAYIDANAVDTVIIVGGTAVVSQDIEDALAADGITVVRLAGDTRYESSVEIAEFHVTQGFTLDEVAMATGEDFADALAGGPYAAQMGAPMVLTQTATLTPATAAFLTENCQAIDALSILGGTAAITGDVEAAAAAAAQCDTNQSLAVSPADTTIAAFDQTAGAGEIVEVTVSGADPDGEYDIALFPCYEFGQGNPSAFGDGGENLLDLNGVSNTDQVISFMDRDFDDVADDAGNVESGADIVSVNFDSNGGTPQTYFEDQSPDADGDFLVRVTTTGGTTDCVHVVAWEDADDDDALLLNNGTSGVENDNTPAVPFGVSGAITWTSGEAPNGYGMGEDVFFVDKSSGYFIDENGWMVMYDEGDTFYYDGSDVGGQISFSVFEGFLSLQDGIGTFSGSYSRVNPVAFEMFDDMGFGLSNTPTVTVLGDADEEADGDEVMVSWTEQDDPGADIDSYNVEIFNATTGASVATGSTASVDTLGGGDAITQLMFSDLADGTYVARIQAETETGYVSSDSLFSEPFTTGTPPEADAPIITNTELTSDTATLGLVDGGDALQFDFNENMSDALDAPGTFLRLSDGDSTYQIVCEATAAPGTTAADTDCLLTDGGDATVDDDQLSIDIGTDAADLQLISGTDNGLDYVGDSVVISVVSGDWDDESGNQLDLAGSTDIVVDIEP
ncbi:cell wall-binding repeat-containing protein [Acidimicrobiia bacterium EGI L10123]|uniref:cell wall-binding repeat-containing protein n=1 Tax=Salinilacustrithrix flava TaxID=2957203 RepID=UPI003D7C2705|nr:cell wall-binding repeat-containing protein [Acidimicrobiia bacterium EGI L10123]